MWLFLIAAVLVLFAIVGGVFAGGVFTIVLVPLAAIAVVSAVVFGIWGRAAQGSQGAETDASHTTDRPLPHQRRQPSGRAPSSPERLADARRVQQ